MIKRKSVLICIDVEPNERAINPHDKQDWTGFEKSFEVFMQVRPLLVAATRLPVHFCWFFRMDPQIAETYGSAGWAVTRYRKLLDELESAGDEIGLHAHAWRWDDQNGGWIQDFGNQVWVDHCVRSSFEAFQETFKRPCRSFRFGDQWMNDETLATIESLGARFDLTPEPARKKPKLDEPFTGSLPDYSRILRKPYRPSRRDFRKRNMRLGRRLWVIPITTANMGCSTTFVDSRAAWAAMLTIESANPAYEGYHDLSDCYGTEGWVWDKNQPDTPLNVEIYDGESFVAMVAANAFRPDLLRAGKGNGKHAFRYAVPDS
ncbi:MAG: hypothetical protein WAV20_22395, partial [Blastocatellia bacterium]